MKYTVILLSLMVACVSAAPMSREFDFGSLFSFLAPTPPASTPAPSTPAPSTPAPTPVAGGGDGGDGTGVGTVTDIGDDATVIGGTAPGSGFAFLGDGSLASFLGVSTGIGIGGDGGR